MLPNSGHKGGWVPNMIKTYHRKKERRKPSQICLVPAKTSTRQPSTPSEQTVPRFSGQGALVPFRIQVPRHHLGGTNAGQTEACHSGGPRSGLLEWGLWDVERGRGSEAPVMPSRAHVVAYTRQTTQ